MRYSPIDPALFRGNRERLFQKLAPNAVVVLHSNDIYPKSGDGSHSFVQSSDLFYLTGIDQAETILVLCPDAPDEKQREILFVRETNDTITLWEGARHTKEEASAISGIQTVHWTDAFESVLRPLVLRSHRIYLNTNEHPRADTAVETRDARFLKWCRSAFPLHRYERLAPLMRDLRVVKSDIEIGLIKQACHITNTAFRRLLGFVRPGVWEFEIEAELVHTFIRNRSRGPAYETIVAGGANACVLHYVKNDARCRDGDLVLIDFGAEYANYAADVTRTLPVSGRFSPRQRAVYDAVLRVQRAAMQEIVPGNTMDAYNRAVGEYMEAELVGLGLLKRQDARRQDKENPLYRKYFMHGISHHLGLDVHDLGDRYHPFAEGMVLTCEPGIYIREEGFGIRLENDVLVTRSGCVDLTAEIPIEAEEIEMLMQTPAEGDPCPA